MVELCSTTLLELFHKLEVPIHTLQLMLRKVRLFGIGKIKY